MRLLGKVALWALAAGGALALLFTVWVFSPWGRQDSCLDAGGAWRGGECIGARPGG